MKKFAQFLLALVFPLIAHSDEMVRISILSLLQPKEVRVTLLSPTRGMFGKIDEESPILSGQTITVRNTTSLRCEVACRVRLQVDGKMDRIYSGQFDFYYNNSTINIAISTHSEALVESITSSEMRGAGQSEAIKAFAVVSRSFLSQSGRHPELHADFCDTTHCQVFQNLEASQMIRTAVEKTESLILTYNDRPFQTFYSRSCGGRTATIQEAWGEHSIYEFPSVSCPCNSSTWQTALSFDELHHITGLTNAKLVRNESRIVVWSESAKKQFPLEIFRAKLGQAYGWKKLPGNHYEVAETSNGYLFSGNGQGHGVGFCQTGAEILAAKGFSFSEILSHYFPGSQIRSRQDATTPRY
jgi:stage II sporulation protein D